MPSLETSDTSSPAAEQFTIEASLPESINAVNTNGASRETIPIVSNHHTNGTTNNSANGHTNGRTNGNTNGHSNGGMDDHSPTNGNGVGRDTPSPVTSSSTATKPPVPIAICGMALRLPGGLETPQDLWDFLMAKGDARSRVPESRYNISAYHSDSGRPGTIATQYGYFLDDDVKLGSLDAARFSLSRAELEFADPQQRRMLEVVREAFDDAGVVDFKVSPIIHVRTTRSITDSNLRAELSVATWVAMAKTGWRCKTGITSSLVSIESTAIATSCFQVASPMRWI